MSADIVWLRVGAVLQSRVLAVDSSAFESVWSARFHREGGGGGWPLDLPPPRIWEKIVNEGLLKLNSVICLFECI